MRNVLTFVLTFFLTAAVLAQDKADRPWISTSNDFTNMLVRVELKHNPENGSRQGLAEYDELVSQPTLTDEDQERKEREEVLAKYKAALPQQKQKEVAQDLEIIIRSVELNFAWRITSALTPCHSPTPAAWYSGAFACYWTSRLRRRDAPRPWLACGGMPGSIPPTSRSPKF